MMDSAKATDITNTLRGQCYCRQPDSDQVVRFMQTTPAVGDTLVSIGEQTWRVVKTSDSTSDDNKTFYNFKTIISYYGSDQIECRFEKSSRREIKSSSPNIWHIREQFKEDWSTDFSNYPGLVLQLSHSLIKGEDYI